VSRPVVVLAIGLSVLLSGCARTSDADLAKAKAAGASEEAANQKVKAQQEEQARLSAEVKKLQQEADKAKKNPSSGPSSSARLPAPPAQAAPATGRGTSCGGNLSVSRNTSCAFAANVRAAFYAGGGGTRSVEAYSPVTGRYYTMRCVAGIPSVCRGGINAVVYIR
jgi:hypothetical protein